MKRSASDQYPLQVERGRFDYPDLKAKALAVVERERPDAVLIENAATGTVLAAELSARGVAVVPIKVQQDKVTRTPIDSSGAIRHPELAMASGEMTWAQFTTFLCSAFQNLVDHSSDGSIHFICMDWRHIREVLAAADGL